jgi:assimilatory nitrate reductase catalytic subunit
MATIPVDERRIIERFGPHRSAMTGVRLSTTTEPERLVKTHCCFCGQQCGVQLKVRQNQVVGFEPWEEFPFNRGMLCPKGVKRYLQGAHPDRLTTALQRDPHAVSGFTPMGYETAIGKAAAEIARLQQTYGAAAFGMLGGASLTTEKTYLLGKFARVCLRTPYIDYNGRLCMVSAGAANKKAFGIDRTTNPWSDMVGTDVIWIAGSNVAECSPITTNYMGPRVCSSAPATTRLPKAPGHSIFRTARPASTSRTIASQLTMSVRHTRSF